jgi:hypothetical protein
MGDAVPLEFIFWVYVGRLMGSPDGMYLYKLFGAAAGHRIEGQGPEGNLKG